MTYNWQQKDWPLFKYQLNDVDDLLYAFAEETGRINGVVNSFSPDLQLEALIDIMVAEAIKTSEIEGEYLSRQDVKSSIRNKLGLNQTPQSVKDRMSKGAGELMVVVRESFQSPLTEENLYSWHRILIGDNKNITVGAWRSHDEPMQVVSGALGKEKIHYEAPPSSIVAEEMRCFINWFNETAPEGAKPIKKAPLRSAIAHLYFESIHPFEDGNGRIGRSIAEKALSQTLGRSVLLSISRSIEASKNVYYYALEKAQKSNEISNWIRYFVELLLDAQRQTTEVVNFILKKSQFFDKYKNLLNERQLKVVTKMFDAGTEGFEGGMNARKYISITKSSKATATRDLQYLLDQCILTTSGGGRSTHYFLNI